MSEAFRVRTLGRICDEVRGTIRTGPFGSQLHRADYSDEGVPVVMPQDLVDGRIVTASIARVDHTHAIRLSQHRLGAGDIVYGRRGDIGRRALVKRNEAGWLCGTGCLRISLGCRLLDPCYLYYYLGTNEVITWVANQAIGATLPNLNTSILRSVPIRYPDLGTQRKIASILSAYDDLIENNLRRIKILEEMAQSLYKEWFVDFRFPGHENIKMIDSPLGMIPEGWEVVAFADTADVLSGGTPKTSVSGYWDSSIPFFTPRDASTSPYVLATEKSISPLGLQKCASSLFPRDSVFITARGTVGKVVLPAVDMAMNQSCYALQAKRGLGQLYLFHLTRASADQLKKTTGGATFDTIVVDTLDRLRVVQPLASLACRFEDTVRPLFDLLLALLKGNAGLATTRDLLLPKLISGEFDVSDLDIAVGEDAA